MAVWKVVTHPMLSHTLGTILALEICLHVALKLSLTSFLIAAINTILHAVTDPPLKDTSLVVLAAPLRPRLHLKSSDYIGKLNLIFDIIK